MVGYKEAMDAVRRACDRLARRGDAAYQGDPRVWSRSAPAAVISIAPGPDDLITGSQLERVEVVANRTQRVWVTIALEHSGDTVERVTALERGSNYRWSSALADDRWVETLVGMIETAVSNIDAQKEVDNGAR